MLSRCSGVFCTSRHLLASGLFATRYRKKKPSYFYEGFVLYGAGTRSRTRDLLITSQRVQGYPLIYESIQAYTEWGFRPILAFTGLHENSPFSTCYVTPA